MRTFLICIASMFGLIAIPASASAEPQYVWVHYGNGQPYLYVTETPYPAPVTTVQRDGVVFDSELGAICGTVHTQVDFEPFTNTLGQDDRNALAAVAHCVTRGALRGKTVRLAITHDGSAGAEREMYERLGEVMETLQHMGVSSAQMVYSKELAPTWRSGRVSFHLASPVPASMLEGIPVDRHRCTYIGPLT